MKLDHESACTSKSELQSLTENIPRRVILISHMFLAIMRKLAHNTQVSLHVYDLDQSDYELILSVRQELLSLK